MRAHCHGQASIVTAGYLLTLTQPDSLEVTSLQHVPVVSLEARQTGNFKN